MTAFTNKKAQRLAPLVAILACAAFGLSLSTQGWRSRITTFDLIPAVERAQDFIASGRVPDRGILTSFASYTPPGTVWLMLPGVLAFKDPRLFEFVGTGILYVGTLFGIFLLARSYFGMPCALLSVGLYGLSELGLFYSGSLWPRGHPFFYVWMAYWAGRWVAHRKTRYLAAALVTWAAGMYVFMEIAPAIFMVPVIWFLYRPPLKVTPLIVAAAAIFALWYPYLRFESTRGFADIRSQVLRHKALPTNYRDSWCDPHIVLRSSEGAASVESVAMPASAENRRTGFMVRLGTLWGRWNWIPANFEHTLKIGGNSVALAALALVSLFLISISSPSAARAPVRRRRWITSLAVVSVCLIVVALLCNELLIARFASDDGRLESSTIVSIRRFEVMIAAAAMVLMIFKTKIVSLIERLKFTGDVPLPLLRHPDNAKLFCISLMVPWLVLLLVVESDEHLERFWWLWPLQVIALAALVTYVSARLQLSRIFACTASACLAAMLLLNPSSLLSGVGHWGPGWSGEDAAEIRVADALAQRLAGKNHAAIGYQMYIWRFMASFNVADPKYKVGADFDLLYKTLHGISNTDRCAEGISSGDEFRIVQINPNPRDLKVTEYFDVSADKNFQLVEQFGPYQLFQRF